MTKTYQNGFDAIERVIAEVETDPPKYGFADRQEVLAYYASALRWHFASLPYGRSPFSNLRTPQALLEVYPVDDFRAIEQGRKKPVVVKIVKGQFNSPPAKLMLPNRHRWKRDRQIAYM